MPSRSREACSLPGGLLLARSPRMEREPLRLLPRGFASCSYPQSTPRRRQALAHWPEYYTYGINRTSKRCLLLHSCTLMSHPAIRCFEHHLGVDASPLKFQLQRERIVVDPYRRELFTGFGLTHDHRAPPMQIDPDELPTVILIHRGLPWFVERGHPQHPPGTSRGAEAPPLHHIKLSAVGAVANHISLMRHI